MSLSSGRFNGRGALVVLALWSTSAAAQELDAGVPDAGDPGVVSVSPEELEALERAMAEDAAAAEAGPALSPAAENAPPAPAANTGGFGLQSLNPDIAFITDVAAAYFSSDEPLQSGGHDPQATGFTLQQLELSVGKSVDPYFRFDANIVFSQFGVEIEEAYATTLALPHQLQLRIGQFLTRFGRINASHPHAWSFVDQPFAIGRVFGGEGNRGLGGEVSWLSPLPWYVELVGSVTDARGEATARSFFGADPLEIESPLDFQYTGAVKQFFPISDDLSLLWGLSAATGPNASGYSNRSDVYGTDVFLKYRPISDPSNPTILSLQAEVLYRRRQIPDDLLQDFNGYVQAFWRFEQRWGVAGRYEFGSAAYGLDGVVVDPLDPEWLTPRHRVAANVTFWPTEFSRIRLQAGSDVPTWRAEPTWSLMLAFEFAVGAHGAHTF